jgi:HD domain
LRIRHPTSHNKTNGAASLCHSKPQRRQTNQELIMTDIIAGIRVPDSLMARAATQLVRDTEDDLLYNHSRRTFLWAALTGERRGLKYDAELLYIGAMFHDMGLTPAYASKDLRFEVDGANAAREFLKGYDIPERDIEDVWTAIALHTTPGVPEHMRPTVALVTSGVEMDVLGIAYHDFTHEQRDHVCAHHPREHNFKENIIDHFAQGIIAKPETTFGNVKADVLALKDPEHFVRGNFCSIILGSRWPH